MLTFNLERLITNTTFTKENTIKAINGVTERLSTIRMEGEKKDIRREVIKEESSSAYIRMEQSLRSRLENIPVTQVVTKKVKAKKMSLKMNK